MIASATPHQLLAAQQAAITEAGWGRKMHIFQPRNFSSWVFLYYLIMGAFATYHYFRPSFDAVTTTAVIGTALFAIYVIPFAWMLRALDHWTQLPVRLAGFAFLWGGVTATFFFALPANTAILSIYNKAVSATFAQDWGPGLAAPFSEETGKGIGILLLMFIAPRVIRTPFDGFIVGAFVGLGFEVVEDLSYAINEAVNTFASNEVGSTIKMFVLRGTTGIASHALFSAIFGCGLVYLVGTSATRPNRVRGITWMLAAMVTHGVWDAATAIAGALGIPAILFLIVVVVIELTILYLLFQRVARGEGSWMRDLMGPDLAQGTISEAELTALSGNHHDRREYLKHHPETSSKKKAKQILEAATDLAKAIASSGGPDTPEAVRARSELARIRTT